MLSKGKDSSRLLSKIRQTAPGQLLPGFIFPFLEPESHDSINFSFEVEFVSQIMGLSTLPEVNSRLVNILIHRNRADVVRFFESGWSRLLDIFDVQARLQTESGK